ncbi:MAG: helix-turn-helix transcriptional regulator [Sciscionella sp.]
MTTARRRAFAMARRAAGHTQESLAGALYVDRSTVIRWEAGENLPVPYLWPKLGRALAVSPDRLQALLAEPDPSDDALAPGVVAVCEWLDARAGWTPGTARRKVGARRARWDTSAVRARSARRARVPRSRLAGALSEYYGDCPLYRARCDGHEVTTTIAVHPEWVDTVLNTARLDQTGQPRAVTLDAMAARAAIERLAESLALGVPVTDASLYRLLSVGEGCAVFDLVSFAEYAVTADLMEAELLDAVAQQADMPLRERYLPDSASVFDLAGRLCAGGTVTLCAIARGADTHRAQPDYALLVQKRSGNVLNAAGRLAVIPKGFHQPLTDPWAEVAPVETVRRELEEELFARAELDNTLGEIRTADPTHPSRLSEPMRWLAEHDGLRIEPTGFGLNLISGNYEFASLAVVDNEDFWTRYGGMIEANWEATGLRTYSTHDRLALAELVTDESWSNEGLFALLQGIHKLQRLGGARVELPVVEPL